MSISKLKLIGVQRHPYHSPHGIFAMLCVLRIGGENYFVGVNGFLPTELFSLPQVRCKLMPLVHFFL